MEIEGSDCTSDFTTRSNRRRHLSSDELTLFSRIKSPKHKKTFDQSTSSSGSPSPAKSRKSSNLQDWGSRSFIHNMSHVKFVLNEETETPKLQCPTYQEVIQKSKASNRPPGLFKDMSQLTTKFKRDLISRIAMIDADKKNTFRLNFDILAIALSPDGEYLATASSHDSIVMYNLSKNVVEQHYHVPNLNPGSLLILSDSNTLVAGSSEGILFFFDIRRGGTHKQVTVASQVKISGVCEVVLDTNEGEIVEESKLESEGEKHIIVAGSEEGMLVLVDSKDRSVIFKMITHIEKSERVLKIQADCMMKFVLIQTSESNIYVYDMESRQQQLKIQNPHLNPIQSLIWANRTQIFTSATDNSIALYDIERKRTMFLMKNIFEEGSINSVHRLNNQFIAVSSSDGEVKIFDLASHKFVFEMGEPGELLSTSHDGRTLIAASGDGIVTMFHFTLGCNTIEKAHQNRVSCLIISNDNKHVISGSWDRSLKIFDIESKTERWSFYNIHEDHINAVAISHDDIFIATGSSDKSIKLFENETEVHHFKNIHKGSSDQTVNLINIVDHNIVMTIKNIHNDTISNLSMSSDGLYLITNSLDGSCNVLNTENHQVIYTFQETQGSYKCVAMTSDSSKIFLATADYSIQMVDFPSKRLLHTFKNVHENQITAIAVAPSNSYFVSVSRDKSLKIFDIELKKLIRCYPNLSEEWLTCLTISSDSHYIIAGSMDQSIKVLSMGIPYDEDTYCDISEEEICAAVLSNDRYLMFLGSKNGILTSLDYETKEVLLSRPFHEGSINCLSLSQCGNMLISGSSDRSIRVMAIENNQDLYHFERAHEESIMAVEMSYNNRFVISGCAEGSIRIFEIIEQKEVHTFNSIHNGPVSAIKTFHHSNNFASSSHDGSVKLFGLGDMAETYHFRHVHNDKINAIAISSDDKILFSASSDLSVKIFDIETKQLIRALLNIHQKPITCLSVSSDFEFMITGSSDGTSKVFDLDTMQEIHQYSLFSKKITSVTLSKDNMTAIYTSSDRSVKYIYISQLINSVSCSFGEKKLDAYSLYGLYKLDLLFQALSKSLNIKNILIANKAIYVNPYGWNILHLVSIFYPKLFSSMAYSDLKVPFKLDSYGRTPIHYTFAHQNVDYSIANLQMRYLVEYLEDTRGSLSPFEFTNLMKELSPIVFPLFFYRIDPSISNRFLSFCIQKPMTPNLQEVPRFGSVKSKRSYAFKTNEYPVLNQSIQESILDETDSQAVSIKCLMLQLNYNLWSEDILNSVVTMMQISNEDFFQNKAISVLIEHLWRKVKLFHEILAALFSILMFLLSMYLGLPERNIVLENTILVLAIFFLFYEVFQLALSGLEAYFSDVWNWIDILYYITLCSTISCISYLDDNQTKNWLFSFCLLLGYVRLTSFLRIFDQTRNLIRIILVVIKDMRSFILILLLAVFGFSLVFYGFNRDIEYLSHLFKVYNLVYGNMPNSDLSVSEVELTILITFIVNIILLNLLIATMGGTYDRVYKMRVLNDSKEKLEMILETILAVRYAHRIRCKKDKKKDSKREFLIYVEGCKEFRGEENTNSAENSIIKALESQIQELKNTQVSFEARIENRFSAIEKKMESREARFERKMEKYFENFQEKLLSEIAKKNLK